jgi:hypothetical protein
LLQGSLPKRGNAGIWPALRHEIWAACCSSFDGTASTTHKEFTCFVLSECYLFSQLSDDIVFVVFGQMSELHQFDFLGTSLERIQDHLETFNRPDLSMKKDKKSSASFQRFVLSGSVHKYLQKV